MPNASLNANANTAGIALEMENQRLQPQTNSFKNPPRNVAPPPPNNQTHIQPQNQNQGRPLQGQQVQPVMQRPVQNPQPMPPNAVQQNFGPQKIVQQAQQQQQQQPYYPQQQQMSQVQGSPITGVPLVMNVRESVMHVHRSSISRSRTGLIHIKGLNDLRTLPRNSRIHIIDYNDAVKWQQAAPRSMVVTDSLFQQEALNQHNYYRQRHNSPPLILDKDLSEVAQGWANKLAALGQKTHSANGYGECIFWKSSGLLTGYEPVDTWYREHDMFNWKKVDTQDGTHNFTQVIWKNTKKFGIAVAQGGFGMFVVANYFPPGNFRGQYEQNLSPAQPSERDEVNTVVV